MSEELKAMEKDESLQVTPKEGDAAAEDYVLELTRPYVFEGQEYTKIDLFGLKKLTVKDAMDAQAQLFNEQEVATALMTETTSAFARVIAAKASGLPIEFFKLAPRRINRLLVQAVRGYMRTDEQTVGHVMVLDEPYNFKGKQYTEIDLNCLENMTSENESEAENRMVRAGFVVTETRFNYVYAVAMASMGTGLPEEFFTGLPIYETVKLKNAVNDAGFFE